MTEVFAQLVEARIQLLATPEIQTHFVFERDGFIALVERRGSGFGKVGTPGLVMEKGMAQLLWRGSEAFFVAKGWERAATSEEVESLRNFGADLARIFG